MLLALESKASISPHAVSELFWWTDILKLALRAAYVLKFKKKRVALKHNRNSQLQLEQASKPA